MRRVKAERLRGSEGYAALSRSGSAGSWICDKGVWNKGAMLATVGNKLILRLARFSKPGFSFISPLSPPSASPVYPEVKWEKWHSFPKPASSPAPLLTRDSPPASNSYAFLKSIILCWESLQELRQRCACDANVSSS